MQIQLLSNNVSTKTNKSGKPYQALEVAYKNLSFNGKVESKQLFDFGPQAASFKELAAASTGTVYEIEVVKNAAGYNDWTKVTRSEGGSATSAGASQAQGVNRAASSVTPATSGGTVAKGTWETPEERAKKQIYIVRQSSISSAIELLSVATKTQPKIEEVIEAAKAFEDFVFGTDAAKVAKQDTGMPEDMNEDVPY